MLEFRVHETRCRECGVVRDASKNDDPLEACPLCKALLPLPSCVIGYALHEFCWRHVDFAQDDGKVATPMTLGEMETWLTWLGWGVRAFGRNAKKANCE